MTTDKPRADLVALLLQFEAAADHRGSLYLSGNDAGRAIAAWCDLRGHQLEVGTLIRVTDGKTIAWTHYTVRDTADLPGWTVTCALHDDHEVTAPQVQAQADQEVLARVQAALDGERPAVNCCGRCGSAMITTSAGERCLKECRQLDATEGSV